MEPASTATMSIPDGVNSGCSGAANEGSDSQESDSSREPPIRQMVRHKTFSKYGVHVRDDSPVRHQNHHRHHHHHISRNHSISTHVDCDRKLHIPNTKRAIDGAIDQNTQEAPMSSESALKFFTQISTTGSAQGNATQCVSVALERLHRDLSEATSPSPDAIGEFRMNFGNGRNGVYVAPCERHLECPLEKKGEYLVHTHKPKIMTDLSKVEFGIKVEGWERVVFKTVSDKDLAQRELSFYHKIQTSKTQHVMRLLDEFTDNSGKKVMVFPQMSTLEIYGRSLYDIAYISKQLFIGLGDLHELGIAHLDVTPTNMMVDPNDSSHTELIDFGLACDLTSSHKGMLPSRGTCGFVAPEVLIGQGSDFRADIYSAGVVLGMMLREYLPTVDLRLLGGPLIRSDTTDMIIGQLDELLDAYEYSPETVDYIETNTTFVSSHEHQNDVELSAANTPTEGAVAQSDGGTTSACSSGSPLASAVSEIANDSTHPSWSDRPIHSTPSYNYNNEDEAAAFAAAYGGSSLYNYCTYSDDDDTDSSAPGNAGTFFGRGNFGTRSQSRSDNQGHARDDYASAYFDTMLPSDTRRGYRSPTNTPVYSRGVYAQSRNVSLTNIASTSNTSNIRYAGMIPNANPPTANFLSGSYKSTQSSCMNRSCKIPLAILHAADLLRWALQSSPQYRPTANQAYEHPFLSSIKVRERQRSGSSALSPNPSVLSQDDGLCLICASSSTKPYTPELDHNHKCVGIEIQRATDIDMFKKTDTDNIRKWADDMSSRIHGTSPKHNPYMQDTVARGRTGADDDEVSNFYLSSDTNGYEDITSYFY